MRFHTNSDFLDAITAASKILGLREVLLEKDYWVTYVLWNLSKSKYKRKVVFKGGTSLSKAYGIIKRFSEDIDLAIITQEEESSQLSANQIKKLIKEVESALTVEPLSYEKGHPQESKGSKFRKTVYSYPQTMAGDFGQASNKLILEINSFANPYPFAEVEIESYLAQYLKDFDPSIIDEYGLGPVTINVLDFRRTFAEKVMGLVRASYESNSQLNQLREKIRHIYDLSKLLEQEEIKNLITDIGQFSSLIAEVRADDQKNQEFQGDWCTKRLSDALIYKNAEEVIGKLELTFKGDFQSLLFDSEVVPENSVLIGQLKQVQKQLLRIDDGN